jgi:predicted transcriptional regulator
MHLEPTHLFCSDDQIALCSECFQSQSHKHHVGYRIQEDAENYRKLLQETFNTLKGKFEVAKSILTDEQEGMAIQERSRILF